MNSALKKATKDNMSTEIELKYLVLSENVPTKISALLNKKQISFVSKINHLTNCYFDAADLSLRNLH